MCTAIDYAMFSAPVKGQEKIMEDLMARGEMFCLDKTDRFGNPIDLSINGGYHYGINRMLSIMYRPCIPTTRTEFTKNKCAINDVTNKTQLAEQLKKSQNYVGEAQFRMIVNQQSFQPLHFNEKTVANESMQLWR
jgi:hypothetical protein